MVFVARDAVVIGRVNCISTHKVKTWASMSIKLPPFSENWFLHAGNREVYQEKKQPWRGVKPYETKVGGRWIIMRAGNLVVVVIVEVVGVVLLGECSLSIMEFESLGLVCCWCEVVFSIWVKVFVVMVAEVGVEDLELVVRLIVRLV